MAAIKINGRYEYERLSRKFKGKYKLEKTSIPGLYLKKRVKKEKDIRYTLYFPPDIANEIESKAKEDGVEGKGWLEAFIIGLLKDNKPNFWITKPE